MNTLLLNADHQVTIAKNYIRACLDAENTSPMSLVAFLNEYVLWNGYYAGFMTALAANVSTSRQMFIEPNEPIGALADRSNYVASFIFDTVRDEYNDRETPHRDTHRCLAQAFITGLIQYFELGELEEASDDYLLIYANIRANDTLVHKQKFFTESLNNKLPTQINEDFIGALRKGFQVDAAPNTPEVLKGIGFHMASELLGDAEYSVIDEWLSKNYPALVKYLKETMVTINGDSHNCYSWISIHSSTGSGVEAEHFEHVKVGVEAAKKFCTLNNTADLIEDGFDEFLVAHKKFFNIKSEIAQRANDWFDILHIRNNKRGWWKANEDMDAE